MVIYNKSSLEGELSQKNLEAERLRVIQNSDAWKQHAALHKKSGLGEAQLHVSEEALFGEKDVVRERFGVPQGVKTIKREEVIKEVGGISYGHNQIAHTAYTSTGSQPDLWASCNCGAEFKAGSKGGKLEVKSYGVVGTDSNATGYAVASNAGYGEGNKASSVYKVSNY